MRVFQDCLAKVRVQLSAGHTTYIGQGWGAYQLVNQVKGLRVAYLACNAFLRIRRLHVLQ